MGSSSQGNSARFWTEERLAFVRMYFLWWILLAAACSHFAHVWYPSYFSPSPYQPLLWNGAAVIAAAIATVQVHHRKWLRQRWEHYIRHHSVLNNVIGLLVQFLDRSWFYDFLVLAAIIVAQSLSNLLWR